MQVSGGACLNPPAEVWGVQGRGFGGFLTPVLLWAVIAPEQQESPCSVQFPAGQALAFGMRSVPTGPWEAPQALLHPLGGCGTVFREDEPM